MYRVRSGVTLALALAVICQLRACGAASAGQSALRGTNVTISTPKALKLTPEDAWNGKGFPPVFKGPSEDSGKLGVASGVVYVAWPLQKQNGFVQILRFGGDSDGFRRSVIRPFYREPGSKGGCTLSWRGRFSSVRSRSRSEGVVVSRWSRHSRGQDPPIEWLLSLPQ